MFKHGAQRHNLRKMSSFSVPRVFRRSRYLKPSLSLLLSGNNNPSNPVLNPKLSPHVAKLTNHYRWMPNSEQNFRYVWVASICTTPSQSSVEKETSSSNEKSSWIDLYLPRQARAYAKLARLDKPIGTWLLAWPCMWSITMAAPPGHFPDFKMMALFGCGALLLRGAGCTVNDLLDRDIDNMVTALILPRRGTHKVKAHCEWSSNTVSRTFFSWVSIAFSRILGASSLLLVFSYPLMKRFTFWPQAYLGLTFNWGALLGWAAVKGSLDLAVVFPMYISGVFWTLVYDTIYAHQDKEDDLKVGVKSTALRFGDSSKEWTTGFGIACISSLALSGYNADIGWPYYAFLAAASGHLDLCPINGLVQLFLVGFYLEDSCNKGRGIRCHLTGGSSGQLFLQILDGWDRCALGPAN
ncbi:4-hydroxybenzoate polyprenyltransferase [Citrus sinensis]|nr:4-hydroxybenzoate polyprenyltransferase [Citrus sinensis]